MAKLPSVGTLHTVHPSNTISSKPESSQKEPSTIKAESTVPVEEPEEPQQLRPLGFELQSEKILASGARCIFIGRGFWITPPSTQGELLSDQPSVSQESQTNPEKQKVRAKTQ